MARAVLDGSVRIRILMILRGLCRVYADVLPGNRQLPINWNEEEY